MNAGSQTGERIMRRRNGRPRTRYARIAALYLCIVLLILALPVVFGSRPLFLALVAVLLLCGLVSLALAIYQGGRR